MAMKFKKILVGVLCLLCSVAFSTGGQAESMNKANVTTRDGEINEFSYSGNITIWSWDNSIVKSISKFNESYPNIKIKYEYVSKDDYLDKFQAAIVSGGEAPDIIVMNNDTIGKFNDMKILERLDTNPYEFNKDQIFNYILPSITDKSNAVVAVPYNVSAAGLAYRRSLANKYFGTDKPEELEKLFSNWDEFIKLGLEVRKKSNGAVNMFDSMEDFGTIALNQYTEPLVNDNKLTSIESFKSIFEKMIKMRDAEIIGSSQQWSPSWFNSFSKENTIFYPCPVWFPRYVIEENELQGYGKWGLMVPPGGGFFWDNQLWGISKKSINKEAAWKYLKWLLLTEDGGKFSKDYLSGVMTHYKKLYEDKKFISYKESSFGEQDLGMKYMNEIFPSLKVRPFTKYDMDISKAFMITSNTIIKDKNITLDKALEEFKWELLKNKTNINLEIGK